MAPLKHSLTVILVNECFLWINFPIIQQQIFDINNMNSKMVTELK